MHSENTAIPSRAPYKLGVVSFLNARPLVYGLDGDPRVDLTFDVPSKLADLLVADRFDSALIPIVDLFRCRTALKVVSDGCIGSDGRTMTVRIFSKLPAEELTHLYADTDSHTSVILSKVIWQEQYGRRIEIIPLKNSLPKNAQAVMLIGDKVVRADLPQMEFDVDLGLAWKALTGLPFVFAAWAARAEADLTDLPAILETARDHGVDRAEEIAQIQGPGLGWAPELALEYLSDCLRFTLDDRMREGMSVFFDLARKHGFLTIDRELVFA